MSTSGLNPASRMRFRASVSIFIGSPMSSTKISPPFAYVALCSTSDTASGMVMKYRMMSGCVTVTGPPSAICFLKSGITEPFEPSTLPKRTATNSVRGASAGRDRSPGCAPVCESMRGSTDSSPERATLSIVCTIISQRRLEAPITFVGFTALSVEISRKRRHPWASAAYATL